MRTDILHSGAGELNYEFRNIVCVGEKLQKMGVKDGDQVTIGTFEMNWGDDPEEKPWFASEDEKRDELIAQEEGWLEGADDDDGVAYTLEFDDEDEE